MMKFIIDYYFWTTLAMSVTSALFLAFLAFVLGVVLIIRLSPRQEEVPE